MKKAFCIISLHVIVFFSLITTNGAFSKSFRDYPSLNSKIIVTLTAPRYEIIETGEGNHVIRTPGSGYLMDPGNPKLPEIVKILPLPQNAIDTSLNVKVVDERSKFLKELDNIEPSPLLLLSSGSMHLVNWGKSKEIKNGKNLLVYGSSAGYPEKCIRILGIQNRKQTKYLRLAFYPFRWHPKTGELEIITEVKCVISFNEVNGNVGTSSLGTGTRSSSSPLISSSKEDTLKDSPAAGSDAHDYVIITSNAVVINSQKLSQFKFFKEAIGHSVLIVTEDQYQSLNGPPPNGRAEKIRQWLIDNYKELGIKYVLLIGDPDPSNGDVPMKMCWPRSHESNYKVTPTDYYYADLTGNWDIDGDGLYGEYPDDNKPGGVDYAAEVWVGRIPVYNNDYETLDRILEKIMDYETESQNTSWRKHVLLPAAILNFDQEPPSDLTRTDGAELAQKIIQDYLNDEGFSSYSLYERQGLQPSEYLPDSPLNHTNVIDEWVKGYGIVCAVGHGSETGIYRKYWNIDEDNDNVADSGETVFASYFKANDAEALDDNHPSIVYLCACNNGYPENSGNLGYSLLKHGAVATLSASRVSWYTAGWTEPNPNYADNMSLGYYYIKKVSQNLPCGEALAEVKEELVYNSSSIWINLQGFNLYGDPEMTLINTHSFCSGDFDYDDDVDGQDLARLASGGESVSVEDFSNQFGKSGCKNN